MKLIRKKVYAISMVISLLFITALLIGCDRGDEPQKISLKNVVQVSPTVTPTANGKEFRVAIAAMISPKETFVFYKELINFIGEQLNLNVQLVQRETYKEINDLLQNNELDMAFVCTGAYVDGQDSFGMKLLVAPVAYGETVYYSYIIVPKDSEVSNLAELRGRHFAFTDPMSNTGRLAPTHMLAQMNETSETFFGNTTYTYSHDKSIEAVARKVVDGAAVDSLVWDYMNTKNPVFTSRTKIIKKSEPYGIPPVVVSKFLDPELEGRLQSLFLHMHEDEHGKEILSKIMVDKFAEVDDRIYDSVRMMKKTGK